MSDIKCTECVYEYACDWDNAEECENFLPENVTNNNNKE